MTHPEDAISKGEAIRIEQLDAERETRECERDEALAAHEMDRIKPGTRCECDFVLPGTHGHEVASRYNYRCIRDAVRLVTVRATMENTPLDGDTATLWQPVPMCDACARFHEVHS